METIRHLVSAIQTKVLAFWDNLNKTWNKTESFGEPYEKNMSRHKFSFKEDGGKCAWTAFLLVKVTVLPVGCGCSYHLRAASGVLTSKATLKDTCFSISLLKVHLLQRLKLCFAHLQCHVFLLIIFFSNSIITNHRTVRYPRTRRSQLDK